MVVMLRMKFTVTLRTDCRDPVDPQTLAAVCEGISSLANQEIVAEGQVVQVAAKVDRLTNGSLVLGFLITAALSSAAAKTAIGSIATGLAATAIWEGFRRVHEQSDGAKRRKAEEFAKTLRHPKVVDALKDIFDALQRDAAVSGLKIEADKRLNLRPVQFDTGQIERADEALEEIEPELLRGEQILWRKHIRILEIVGEPPVVRWRIWWDQPGGDCTAWVSAPRIPGSRSWTPGKDKTLVVDLRIRYRGNAKTFRLQSAEIFSVLWAEMGAPT